MPGGYIDRSTSVGGGVVRRHEEMRHEREWAEEHWDVIAVVSALAIALVISVALGVAYSMATWRLQTRVPEPRPASAAPAGEPSPRQPAAPYS